MERAIRPEARPSYRTRAVVALCLTALTLLHALTFIGYLVSAGATGNTFVFFYTGLLTMILAGFSWVAWRWTGRAAPRSFGAEDDEAEPHRHRGLAGEYEPPTRW